MENIVTYSDDNSVSNLFDSISPENFTLENAKAILKACLQVSDGEVQHEKKEQGKYITNFDSNFTKTLLMHS